MFLRSAVKLYLFVFLPFMYFNNQCYCFKWQLPANGRRFDASRSDLETPLLHIFDHRWLCRVRHLDSWQATRIQPKRFLGRRHLYSANVPASFNPSILEISLSGDIHPQPGPNTSNLSSTSTNAKINFPSNTKSNVRIAHLNIRSLKSREHFILLSDSIATNSFDIFTISETWLDSSVDNASIHIPGYTLFRQDRGPCKPGGGLCV